MSVEILEEPQKNIVEVDMTGKLTKEDYQAFVPRIEEVLDKHGKVRMLLVMHDFHGWNAGAAWEDLKFGTRHVKDIERLAIVGEKRWQAWLAKMSGAVMKAPVHYFEAGERDSAWAWLTAG